MLNEQQQKALDLILAHIEGEIDADYIWITGAAGTGKTFTIGKAIEECYCDVCIAAPTQRAVATLKAKSPRTKGDRTIHSLLGLRDDEKSFDLSFIQQAKVQMDQYDVIFIDESSMINVELFESLLYFKGDTKLIFIGDIEQLEPVEGHPAPIFIDTPKTPGIRLTKIERQGEGSPIIDLASSLLESLDIPDDAVYKENEQGATYVMNSNVSEDREIFKEQILEHFTSKEFQQSNDYARILCATNKMVAQMNAYIRNAIYGEEAKEEAVLIGERMIASGMRHIFEDNKVVLVNNDEFVVEGYTTEMEVIADLPFFYYLCDISYTNKKGGCQIRIIHPQSKGNYQRIIDHYLGLKKNLPPKSGAAYEAAKEYKSFLSYFAQVDYSYSMTTHKSQGSTLQNVFILMNDLMSVQPWNYDTKRRWMYTAVTRAAKKCFVIY